MNEEPHQKSTQESALLGKTREELIELAKRYTWFPNGHEQSDYEEPARIAVSQGDNYFVDIFGNKYLEASSGFAGCTLGRNNSYITEAIIGQLRQNPIVITGCGASPVQILLSQKIAERVPGSLNRVFYGLSGSDANEIAIKIARQYWKIKGQGGKFKLISRWRSYHGAHFGSGSAAGYPYRRASFEPLPVGFIHTNPPYCFDCPYKMTYPQCNVLCAEELRHVIENEHPSTIAAWIGDLVITALGPFPSPPEYVKRIREICDEYGILMIVDEVITGWGRMGTWTASEYYGIVPDMLTLGKGVSALYMPLSVVVVKNEIADLFTGDNTFQHVITVAGNPPSCAAGLAAIEFIEKERILDRVKGRSVWLQSEAEKLKNEFWCVGGAYCIGMELGIEIVKNKETRERFTDPDKVAKLIRNTGLKRNVSLTLYYGHITIAPSLTATDEELERILDAVREALKEVQHEFR